MELTLLKEKVDAGLIDTVITVFPDGLGRLVGKRFTASYFLDHVVDHGTHGCNYLFAVNVEMDPLDGFELVNWNKGFGDFEMRSDLSSLRELPWQPGSALVICDLFHHDGQPVSEAPRQILRQQIHHLEKQGLTAGITGELEFFLFNQNYSELFQGNYANLRPSSDYRIDYHTMQPARDEPFLRVVRNQMGQAGVPIESSKGEWGCGQHEVNFIYGAPLEMADRHVLFKQGVKEIAAVQGRAVSFIPKLRTDEAGNSCHIHVSVSKGGVNMFWDAERKSGSDFFRHFLGGLIHYGREMSLLFAPTINAYKRFQSASWAPTKIAWAYDNRTVGYRVVGQGNAFRIENRMPGADANPYHAFAATLAAGMAGVREKLDCGPCYEGNAYEDPKLDSLPKSLEAAAFLFKESQVAREAFGDKVVDFLVQTALIEVAAFDEAVTDWERKRYFERI